MHCNVVMYVVYLLHVVSFLLECCVLRAILAVLNLDVQAVECGMKGCSDAGVQVCCCLCMRTGGRRPTAGSME